MNVRNHIAVRIGVGWRSLCGIIWVDVRHIGNSRELRHEEEARDDRYGRQQCGLTSPHITAPCVAYASP